MPAMRNRWFHKPILHTPLLGVEKKVSWLELFYDLIFVAAFIQLGNGLAKHPTPSGVAMFAGMFIPLWLSWTGFTFFENRYSLDDFLHRAMVLAQMAAVGGMAISAPGVLDGIFYPFAIWSGVAQSMVALMYLRAFFQEKESADYARFWGAAFAVGGIIWSATGVLLWQGLMPVVVGVILCGLATLGILSGALSRQSRALSDRYPIDFEHLGERYGLLTIIVLGESFVKVLSELAAQEEGLGLSLYLDGGIVLLVTCGIWWIYFDDVAGAEVRKGPGKWIVWLYAHIPLQIAVTATGVAIKKAVYFNWDTPAPDGYRYLLVGSIAAVYMAVAAIDSVTHRKQAELSDRARVNVRAVSGIFLLALGAAGGTMSGGMFLVLVSAVAVGNVLFDMMMAPFEEDEHSELGVITHAERYANEQRTGERAARPRRPDLSTTVRKGTPSDLRRDMYFYFIEGSWWRVITVFTVAFVASNIFFAALYVLDPTGITGVAAGELANEATQQGATFMEAFHFSVQTMTTIGYGTMSPQSPYVHALVTIEAAVGIVGVAIMTGLVFAKLSRPNAGVLFSKPVVITTLDGVPHLLFRIGNTRGNDIVDARVTFTALIDSLTAEGHHFGRLHDLKLTRDRSPIFSLSWSVMHPIDESSPLYGLDLEEEPSPIRSLIVTLLGHDGTYGQTNYARHLYDAADLEIGRRFVDIIHHLPDGRMMVDYHKFHLTQPDAAPAPQAAAEEADAT
jgi:inward rectifier potassium channel